MYHLNLASNYIRPTIIVTRPLLPMFHHPNESNSLDALISQIDLNELTQETLSQFCVIKTPLSNNNDVPTM